MSLLSRCVLLEQTQDKNIMDKSMNISEEPQVELEFVHYFGPIRVNIIIFQVTSLLY